MEGLERKFYKEWVEEIRQKMIARKKAIAEGTVIHKDNENTGVHK
jgi:hypothetical protein